VNYELETKGSWPVWTYERRKSAKTVVRKIWSDGMSLKIVMK